MTVPKPQAQESAQARASREDAQHVTGNLAEEQVLMALRLELQASRRAARRAARRDGGSPDQFLQDDDEDDDDPSADPQAGGGDDPARAATAPDAGVVGDIQPVGDADTPPVSQLDKPVAPPAAPSRPPRTTAAQQFRPTVNPGTMKARHYGLVISFLIFVLAPVVVSGWYLWTRAADQYASYVGFSVQKEDTDPAVALLGGITSLSTSSSSDTDILYEYMYSQSLVAEIDAALNLRALWSKPENDPVFSYSPPGTIEDLTEHWAKMVKVFYDSNTRLIELRVLAFDPLDAQSIATAVYNKSSAMINKLAETSRSDAVRYAKDELEVEKARLRVARTAVTAYRNLNRMVDPSADVASQSGLLGNLQTQLATALIELDTLLLSSQPGDPRIVPAERKVKVIEGRIDAERSKLGSGTGVDAEAYADLVAEYEGLAADREFAEGAYRAALAAYDSAQAEARRQGRYLAAHIPPTLAEAARFPDRPVLLGLVALFAFSLWSIVALLYYSLRDRR